MKIVLPGSNGLAKSLLAIGAMASLSTISTASQPNSPNIDVDKLGQLGVVGTFSGISREFNTSLVSKSGLDSASPSIMSFSNGTVTLLAQTIPGGDINAACPYYNRDGSISKIFISGNFDKINGNSAGYVAAVDQNGKVDALQGGLDNSVNALYCDQQNGLVYFAGNFTMPVISRNSSIAEYRSKWTGGVAVYNVTSNQWQALPWKGVDGQITAIAPSADKKHVYFGGNFDSTRDGADYTPLNQIPVNLGAFGIVVGNPTADTNYNKASYILCPSGYDQPQNTLLLADKLPGYIRFNVNQPFRPSLIRLRNTQIQGRGTKTFYIQDGATNAILTLSYVDQTAGIEKFCDKACPLAQNAEYQDFRFYFQGDKGAEMTNGIVINLSDWYGMGAGLTGIELYQRDSVVSSNPNVNGYPECSNVRYQPNVETQGSWSSTSNNIHLAEYSVASIPVSQANSDASKKNVITLYPYIAESGFYDIKMAIPGCQGSNDCRSRTKVKVDVKLTPGSSVSVSQNQAQTLNEVVHLYRGYIAKSSDDFKPSISLRIDDNIVVAPDVQALNIVADTITFIRANSFTNLNGVIRADVDSNGIGADNKPPFGPLSPSLPSNSVVRALATLDDTLYIGGTFVSNSPVYSNIVGYSNGKLVPLADGGLDATVKTINTFGKQVFVGGYFTQSLGSKNKLTRIAAYNPKDSEWARVGGGLDGTVDLVAAWSPAGNDTILVTGSFTKVLADEGHHINETAVTNAVLWNMTSSSWTGAPYLNGTTKVVFSGSGENSSVGYIGGHFSSVAAARASGFASLDPRNRFHSAGLANNELLSASDGKATVSTGIYYAKDNTTAPQLIVGGQFTLPSKATNIARLLANQTWQGLGHGVNGKVLTLANANQYLLIGGEASASPAKGNSPDKGFTGLAIYDMDDGSYYDKLPHLSMNKAGSSAKGDVGRVRVNKIVVRSQNPSVIIGGNFKYAGGFECDSICFYDISTNQFTGPPTPPGGVINDMDFMQSTLVVGGTFVNKSDTSYFLTYRFDQQLWENPDKSGNALPGPVNIVAKDHRSANGTVFYLAGIDAKTKASYIRRFDGSTFMTIPISLQPNSVISGLTILPTMGDNSSGDKKGSKSKRSDISASNNGILPLDSVLVVSGVLHFSDGGHASATSFDGKTWSPMLTTVQGDGSPGSVNSLFWQIPPTPVKSRKVLSPALVILIAVAISLVLVFIVVLVGLAYVYFRNRQEAIALATAAAAITASSTLSAGPVYAKKENDPNYYNDQNAIASPNTAFTNTHDSGAHQLNTYEDTRTFTHDAPHAPHGIGSAAGVTVAAAAAAAAAGKHSDSESDVDNRIRSDSNTSTIEDVLQSTAQDVEDSQEPANNSRDNEASSDRPLSTNPFINIMEQMNRPSQSTTALLTETRSKDRLHMSDNTQYKVDLQNPVSPTNRLSNMDESTYSRHIIDNFPEVPPGEPVTHTDIVPKLDQVAPELAAAMAAVGNDTSSKKNAPIRESLKSYPVFYTKFPFTSREPGELNMKPGDRVFVIDKRDEIWWLGIIDRGSDVPLEQGIFPATYVTSEEVSPDDGDLE
ncbi:hypothetical protein H4219_001528 [Mycoemilia scoparia]|uniref:SH3 domain-containing protein n=1 Tax=Mycoemilia scoparia TaxID=417184 RepID=A0A9W8A804_9FUNG|nr:hypothetical protein H4219_001528 [Mycoemilia scoparia]